MQSIKDESPKNSRMTRQRSLILAELQKVTTHPTAEELYIAVKEKMPRISLGTVYRNLEFLSETGVIRKLDSAGTVRRFDGDMSNHSHVRCVVCNKVADIFEDFSQKFELDSVNVQGFSLASVNVEFEGICHECEKGQNRIH